MTAKTHALEELLTVRQVAELVGVSTQYIHRLIKESRIPATRTALGYLIAPEVAEQLQQEREVKNAA